MFSQNNALLNSTQENLSGFQIETSMGFATNQQINVVMTVAAPIGFPEYVFPVVTVVLMRALLA